MTRIFMSGAEAGSLGVFAATGPNASISTVQKRTEAYSFLVAGNSGLGSVQFVADKTELYFRVGLYLTAIDVGAGAWGRSALIQLRDNVLAVQCGLAITAADRLLRVMRGNGRSGTELAFGVTPVPLNNWCCIEWYIKIADGVAGASTVKLDGGTEITLPAADTKETAVAGARSAIFGAPSLAQSDGILGYFDDLAINDTAGAVNNSWIGRGGIYVKVPNGPGTYTDLHAFGGGGNPWDCINEVPPDDADYVYDDTVDQKSTYAGSVLTPTTGTIDCINVIMRAKLDAAGTGNIARLIRSNGTDSQGADVGLDVSAKTIQDIIETDPSGGGAWTVARVNALEAGAIVR